MSLKRGITYLFWIKLIVIGFANSWKIGVDFSDYFPNATIENKQISSNIVYPGKTYFIQLFFKFSNFEHSPISHLKLST